MVPQGEGGAKAGSDVKLPSAVSNQRTTSPFKVSLRTSAATMSSAAECSKLGFSRALGLGFGLSGDTPGKREELGIRRVSATAQLRRSAHAKSDSLEHSAVVCHA
jgi:hypothetical protein